MHHSLIPRTVRRLLTTLTPVLMLAGCEDRQSPTALLSPHRPSLDLVAGHCVVTSTADAGDGSLRAKIADPDCTTITFGLTLPGTITLTSTTLTIDRDLSVEGPGADKLTVARSAAVQTPLFSVFVVGVGVTSTISGVTISNGNSPLANEGVGEGGGIFNLGVLTLSHSVVSGNAAYHGGGISNRSTMLITHSLVANNSAGLGGGGGIFNTGTLTLAQSTVSGNASQGGGGGVFDGGLVGTDVAIVHSTVTGNSANSGGGIEVFDHASARIRGSVIAGNSVTAVHTADPNSGGEGPDVFAETAGPVAASYSLIGNPSGHSLTATPENGNLVGTVDAPLDPKLGPLALNAPGATATHALLAGSPAIDAGVCTDLQGNTVTDDQRGVPRPQGPTCDMGAYELGPVDATPPAITPSVTGTLGSNGWYVSDVTVSWIVVEQESFLISPPCAPTTINADTPGQVVTCSATSLGGTASQSVTIKRDATKPTLAPVVSPSPAPLNGTATAQPNATDASGGSGIASSSCDTPNTGSVGSQSVTCTATDNAGNTAASIISYQVTYQFGGFLSPVNADVLNAANAGQTVALKWRVTDATGTPVTNLTTATVTVTSLACTIGSTANQVEESAAGGSGLQNLGNGYYQFNWKTPKSYAGSCKTMQLDLGEGITRNAAFEFTK